MPGSWEGLLDLNTARTCLAGKRAPTRQLPYAWDSWQFSHNCWCDRPQRALQPAHQVIRLSGACGVEQPGLASSPLLLRLGLLLVGLPPARRRRTDPCNPPVCNVLRRYLGGNIWTCICTQSLSPRVPCPKSDIYKLFASSRCNLPNVKCVLPVEINHRRAGRDPDPGTATLCL